MNFDQPKQAWTLRAEIADQAATIVHYQVALEEIANSTFPMGTDGFKVWQKNCHTARFALRQLEPDDD